MTIKEAVEYYNDVQEQIKSIQRVMNELMNSVRNRERNPMYYCEIDVETVRETLTFLDDYIKYIADKLNKEFE